MNFSNLNFGQNIKNFINYIFDETDEIYKSVKSLQKRKRKCNVGNIFSVMIASSFGDNCEANFRDHYNSNKDLSSSSMSYWRSKIYNIDFNNNLHNFAVDNNIINASHDVQKYHHLYDKFNILAGDGTRTKTSMRNKNETDKNIATINTVYIYDILHKTFRDHKIAYDNNEHTGLLEHDLSKRDLIILDRYYSSYELMNTLKSYTNFIIRLKSTLIITKEFMKENKNSKVIVHNNTRLKLIKYRIDKNTHDIILDKYKKDNDVSEEDLSEYFVLATNVIKLTENECIYLYKKRWSIEVAFKQLKQHYRIRYVCKHLTSKNPLIKCEFWYKCSIMMYNMASILKNLIDSEKNINCKFSDCARTIRSILSGKLNMKEINIEFNFIIRNKSHKRGKNKINKRKESKRGVYKSVSTINKINKESID